MPEPNLRDLVSDIRQTLEQHSRESLIELLTYVFKEYVVEGPAPMPQATVPMVQDDLEGLTFTQIIQSLQMRLDLPELSLFEVQAGRVYVKVGGRTFPLEAPATRPEPAPAPAPAPLAAPTPPAPPKATANSRPMLPGTITEEISPRPAVPRPPDPPAPVAAPAGTAAKPGAPAAAPATPGKEEGATPAATSRYNLLEID